MHHGDPGTHFGTQPENRCAEKRPEANRVHDHGGGADDAATSPVQRVDKFGRKSGAKGCTGRITEGCGCTTDYPSYNATCISPPPTKAAMGPRPTIGRGGRGGKVVMHSDGFSGPVRTSIWDPRSKMVTQLFSEHRSGKQNVSTRFGPINERAS